jgi:hypothetical protein
VGFPDWRITPHNAARIRRLTPSFINASFSMKLRIDSFGSITRPKLYKKELNFVGPTNLPTWFSLIYAKYFIVVQNIAGLTWF